MLPAFTQVSSYVTSPCLTWVILLCTVAVRWTRGRSGNRRMSPAQRSTAASGLGSALPHTSKAVYLDYNGTTPIFPEVPSTSCSRVHIQSKLVLSDSCCEPLQPHPGRRGDGALPGRVLRQPLQRTRLRPQGAPEVRAGNMHASKQQAAAHTACHSARAEKTLCDIRYRRCKPNALHASTERARAQGAWEADAALNGAASRTLSRPAVSNASSVCWPNNFCA